MDRINLKKAGKYIRKKAEALGKRHEDADDFVQEAFANLLEQLPYCKHDVPGFVAVVVGHTIYADILREERERAIRTGRKPRKETLGLLDRIFAKTGQGYPTAPRQYIQVTEDHERCELNRYAEAEDFEDTIATAKKQLDETDMQILDLLLMETKLLEIAKRLVISERTVKYRVKSIREAIFRIQSAKTPWFHSRKLSSRT